MKSMNHIIDVVITVIVLSFVFLFSVSCNEAPLKNNNEPQISRMTECFSEIVESTDTSITTAGGTEEVPFVPFTIDYTTVDLSAELPLKLANESNFYADGITNNNTYIKDGVLYLYAELYDADGEPKLLPFVDGVLDESGIINVPKINGAAPFFAYALRDGNFCCLNRESVYDEDGAYLSKKHDIYIVKPDGTVIARYTYENDFDTPTTGFHMHVINEEKNGDVSILINFMQKSVYYRYEAESNTITKGRVGYSNVAHVNFMAINAEYLGEQRYFCLGDAGSMSRATVLDMKSALLKPVQLRIPEDQDHMTVTCGADGNYYIYDTLRMYRYHDNAAPTLVAEWAECGVAPDQYYKRMWIVDENSFYISTTTKVLGKLEYHLYFIKTEKVPEYETRETVRFLAYDYQNTWLTEAVRLFNDRSTSYKVELSLIDPAKYETLEALGAALDEKMLYDTHPDMLLMSYRDIPFDHYYDKGVFLDLTEVFGDRILGCVKEAMSYGDRLYTIPMTMQIETFVCLPETIEGFLTWEQFFTIMDSLEENEILTSEPRAQTYIFENGLLDFFDIESQTATYDSKLFCDMVEYTARMNAFVDENAGRLKLRSDGITGYTNTTLPIRIGDGGIKFVDAWIRDLQSLVSLDLLFGDSEISFCGYPANDGGSAFVNPLYRTAILSDTDVRDGCIAFLSFLLSDEMQTHMQHSNLPVTESGMRALAVQQKYYYYPTFQYEAIGDPEAKLQYSGIQLGTPVGIINLDAVLVTEKPCDPEVTLGEVYVYDEAHNSTEAAKYTEVMLENALFEDFMRFLNNCHMKAGTDDTVLEIVTEELSFWEGGVTPIEEAAKKIQSRVQIYLNE